MTRKETIRLAAIGDIHYSKTSQGTVQPLFAHLTESADVLLLCGDIMQGLLSRMRKELHSPLPSDRLCQGTLLSRAQYLIDIVQWGYDDARLSPRGCLAKEEIDHWTAAIGEKS